MKQLSIEHLKTHVCNLFTNIREKSEWNKIIYFQEKLYESPCISYPSPLFTEHGTLIHSNLDDPPYYLAQMASDSLATNGL